MATTVAVRTPEAMDEAGPPLAALLGRVRLFQGLPPEEVARVARWMEHRERRHYAPGEVIIRQAQVGERCYLILSGCVRVSFRHDPESPSQVPIELATLEAGDFFGEMSLLDGLPCSATVTAVQSTRCMAVTKEELVKLLLQHPRAALSMLATISRRLRATEAMLPVPRGTAAPEHASMPW